MKITVDEISQRAERNYIVTRRPFGRVQYLFHKRARKHCERLLAKQKLSENQLELCRAILKYDAQAASQIDRRRNVYQMISGSTAVNDPEHEERMFEETISFAFKQ